MGEIYYEGRWDRCQHLFSPQQPYSRLFLWILVETSLTGHLKSRRMVKRKGVCTTLAQNFGNAILDRFSGNVTHHNDNDS